MYDVCLFLFAAFLAALWGPRDTALNAYLLEQERLLILASCSSAERAASRDLSSLFPPSGEKKLLADGRTELRAEWVTHPDGERCCYVDNALQPVARRVIIEGREKYVFLLPIIIDQNALRSREPRYVEAVIAKAAVDYITAVYA